MYSTIYNCEIEHTGIIAQYIRIDGYLVHLTDFIWQFSCTSLFSISSIFKLELLLICKSLYLKNFKSLDFSWWVLYQNWEELDPYILFRYILMLDKFSVCISPIHVLSAHVPANFPHFFKSINFQMVCHIYKEDRTAIFILLKNQRLLHAIHLRSKLLYHQSHFWMELLQTTSMKCTRHTKRIHLPFMWYTYLFSAYISW